MDDRLQIGNLRVGVLDCCFLKKTNKQAKRQEKGSLPPPPWYCASGRFLFVFVRDRVILLCSLACPGTRSMDWLASASGVLSGGIKGVRPSLLGTSG